VQSIISYKYDITMIFNSFFMGNHDFQFMAKALLILKVKLNKHGLYSFYVSGF
jgi:hypothetical protein